MGHFYSLLLQFPKLRLVCSCSITTNFYKTIGFHNYFHNILLMLVFIIFYNLSKIVCFVRYLTQICVSSINIKYNKNYINKKSKQLPKNIGIHVHLKIIKTISNCLFSSKHTETHTCIQTNRLLFPTKTTFCV